MTTQKLSDMNLKDNEKRVLALMGAKALTTGDVASKLGIAYSTASQLLSIWYSNDYVSRYPKGKIIYYVLNKHKIEL